MTSYYTLANEINPEIFRLVWKLRQGREIEYIVYSVSKTFHSEDWSTLVNQNVLFLNMLTIFL